MPGHKRKGERFSFENPYYFDITEIDGFDNLHHPEGILKESMEQAAAVYGSEKSYFLVNGSSCGLLAAISACVPAGGKILVARNCHKSVFNALTLGGIRPVYAQPELIEEHGILGAVAPEEIERCIRENPEAEAVILPSPNYYGICSDISRIAKIAHDAGKVLIVDQAHGAHLKFFHKFGCGEGMAKAAEDCGADIVINSIHKTLASLTQSAVLNLNSELVDRYVLEDKLQAIQSTSPSYILMGFLDMNADLLTDHGPEVMKEWRDDIAYFYEEAKKIKGLRIMEADNMDIKINLDMGALGIDGAKLEQLLMEKGIFAELYTGDILMLMTGIGNTRDDMERTLAALREIAAQGPDTEAADAAKRKAYSIPAAGRLCEVPMEKEFVKLESAEGRICAGSIIPYPPGIPFVCPGEEITADIVRYIGALRDDGEKVIGVNDRGEVLVGR